jgi:hypothetical protein
MNAINELSEFEPFCLDVRERQLDAEGRAHARSLAGPVSSKRAISPFTCRSCAKALGQHCAGEQ